MTINKSQGQTQERFGLYLPDPVFAHGQLYTGVSRPGPPDGLRVLTHEPLSDAPQGHSVYVSNVVYREALI